MFLENFLCPVVLWDIWGQSLGTVLMTDLLLTNACSHFIAVWPVKELTDAFKALLKITVDLSH